MFSGRTAHKQKNNSIFGDKRKRCYGGLSIHHEVG